MKTRYILASLVLTILSTSTLTATTKPDDPLVELRRLCNDFRSMLLQQHTVSLQQAKLQVLRDKVNGLRASLERTERDALHAAQNLQQNEIDLPVLQRKVIDDPSADVLLKALYESIEVHKREQTSLSDRVNRLQSELWKVENEVASILQEMEDAVVRLRRASGQP